MCSYITNLQMAALSGLAFSGFTSNCAGSFSYTALNNITASQFSNFTTAAIKGNIYFLIFPIRTT